MEVNPVVNSSMNLITYTLMNFLIYELLSRYL